MTQPTDREARNVSRHIPDTPGTVTFEVERTVVRDADGREGVLIFPGMEGAYKESWVERRTVTITNTAWERVQ